MIAPERGKPRSRLALVTGIVLTLLSIAAIVLSLGAPGLGWALASITLVLASVCSLWIGLRVVCLCLAATTIHFVTFGPLTYSVGSNVSWVAVAIFGWGPFIVCGLALLLSFWRRRIGRRTIAPLNREACQKFP